MRYKLLVPALAAILSAQDRVLTSEGIPNSIFFSADGKTIISQCRDGHIRTWDLSSGKQVKDESVKPGTIQIASDFFAEIDRKNLTARAWDLSSDRKLQLVNGIQISETAVSPDRKSFASSSAKDRSVRLYNMETGQPTKTIDDGIGGASALVFSPDGETLVSANYDNDIRVWKTKSGELVKKVDHLTGAMFAAEYTPDGKQLIMAGLDEIIYIWDAKTFALNRKLEGHGETISALAISPDGRTLVTGGFDVITTRNPVKVAFWDLATGKITKSIRAPHMVANLKFSPDGKWVAMTSGEKEISLISTK